MASPAAAISPAVTVATAPSHKESLSSPLIGEAAGSPSSSSSPPRDPSRSRSPSPLPVTDSLPPHPSPPPQPSSASSSKRLAAPCWTDEETLALIDAYRQKWYALRRGNLRASHWQEVADDVASRCPAAGAPKTSVQCRHKVEKLRKRYRNERNKSLQRNPSLPPSSTWICFRHMDALERGGGVGVSEGGFTTAASITSMRVRRPSPLQPLSDEDDVDDGEDEEEDDDRHHFLLRRGPSGSGGNSRSLHRLVDTGIRSIPASDDASRLRFDIPKAVRSKITRVDKRVAEHGRKPTLKPTMPFFKGHEVARPAMDEMWRKLDKKRRTKEKESESVAMNEMVSALRLLGDGFMRMEQRKMEMAREMERVRMDMELKRTELILDSQHRIVNAFMKGFIGRKRSKVSSED